MVIVSITQTLLFAPFLPLKQPPHNNADGGHAEDGEDVSHDLRSPLAAYRGCSNTGAKPQAATSQ
jgi:hypothetical protein